MSEPASELERLITDLSESGLLVFVFGVGWWTAHLTGSTAPVFRGPTGRRWWHVDLGGDAGSWTMDVRVDEITGVRFEREPYPFPSFPGRESLTVRFLGPGGDTVLSCYVHDLYDGQRMRLEKLATWHRTPLCPFSPLLVSDLDRPFCHAWSVTGRSSRARHPCTIP